MFFSPSPITKHQPSSTDQLNRYLPQMEQSRQQKQHALYTNFSTVQQISKSIDMEKERLDQESIIIGERLNQCGNVIGKGKRDVGELKHKIQGMKFGESFEASNNLVMEQPSRIPLQQVYYCMKQRPKQSSSVQKDQINVLLAQIQKLEKDCAKLYLDQNQVLLESQNKKIQSFQELLLRQFDSFNEKMTKDSNQGSEYALLEMKVMEDHEKLQDKIKKWQLELNEEFQEKILKLIDRLQSNAN